MNQQNQNNQNNSNLSYEYQPDELLKSKISQFILNYQKGLLDKQFRNQKIKQTIMIDLLSLRNNPKNKGKNQPSSTAQKQSTVKDFQMSLDMSNISRNSKAGIKNCVSEQNVGKITKNKNEIQINSDKQYQNQQGQKNCKLLPDFFHPNKSRASFKNSAVRQNPQQEDKYNKISMTDDQSKQKQVPEKHSLTDRVQKSQKFETSNYDQKLNEDEAYIENSSPSSLFRKQKIKRFPQQSQLKEPMPYEVTFNEKNLSSGPKKFTDVVFRNNGRNSGLVPLQTEVNQNKSGYKQVKIQDYEQELVNQIQESMGSTTFGKKKQNILGSDNKNKSSISNKNYSQINQNQDSMIKAPSIHQVLNNVSQLRKSEHQNPKQSFKLQSQISNNDEQSQEQEGNDNSDQENDQQNNQKYQKYQNLVEQEQNYQDNEQQLEMEQQELNEKQDHKNQYKNTKPLQQIEQNQSMQVSSKFPQKSLVNNIETQQPSQNSKSYAFQILMDKSTLQEKDVQELRKKKIMQMEKKRLQRLQNHSRNKNSTIEDPHSKSSVGTPSGRNSKLNTHSKDNNRDSLNKSRQQKPHPHKNKWNNQIYDDTQTVASKYYEKNQQKEPNFTNNARQLSPYGRTPKTVQSTKTNIPLNKHSRDNIFVQEPSSIFTKDKKQRNSSSQKYIPTQPKIQPKTIKSTFTKHSNRKLMINAVTYTCLPGQLNRRQRQRLIDVIESQQSEYFVFLFKEYSRKVIKGIYVMDMEQTKLSKIYGDKAPQQIACQMVHQFYRFDSGSRQFKKIDGCKSFSFSIHAIDIK